MHPENTKPAATVHGTGIGEATECARCNRPAGAFRRDCHMCGALLCDTACEEWHIEKDCPVTHDATQPASPTVTLDRADFDKALLRLEQMRKVLSPHAGIDNGMFDECAAIVTLLRAAERQK